MNLALSSKHAGFITFVITFLLIAPLTQTFRMIRSLRMALRL
jgi:hypothetical protein